MNPSALLALRHAHGLTQQTMADLASVTVRAYQRWEHGERHISKTAWALLQVRIAALLVNHEDSQRGGL